MKRRLIPALAAGALIASMAPAIALAGDPIGGCPTGGRWELVMPQHQIPEDRNGDGWVCLARFFVGPGILPIDNVVRVR